MGLATLKGDFERPHATVALEGTFAIVPPASNTRGFGMAANANQNTEPGSMDISEHVKTWNWFVWAVKWAIVANVIGLAFLALFRTHG
jgi:hypothetical protein